MEEAVVCPFCFELLTEPVALACGHNVCRVCALRLQSFSILRAAKLHDWPPKGGPSEDDSTNHAIDCPSCKKSTPLGAGGAKDLPTNQDAEKAVRLYTARSASGCALCMAADAVFECVQCTSPQCQTCFEELHKNPKMPGLKDHTTAALGTAARHKPRLCPVHNELEEIFCLSCDETICSRCLEINQKHMIHKVASIASYGLSSKQELMQLHKELTKQASKLATCSGPMETSLEEVEETSQTTQRDIEAAFGRLLQALMARKEAILEQNRQIFESKKLYLSTQQESIQLTKQAFELFADSARDRSCSTDPYALLAAVRMGRRLLKAMTQQDLLLEPCTQTRWVSTLNTSAITQLIGSFGKVHPIPTSSAPAVAPIISEGASDGVLVEWKNMGAGENPAEGYRVQMAYEQEPFDTLVKTKDTRYFVKGLTKGRVYAVRVASYNSGGESTFSPPLHFVFQGIYSFPYHKQFLHTADFDLNGILYWIGTDLGRRNWIDPASMGWIKVTRSSEGRGDVKIAASRQGGECTTDNEPNSWFAFDLGPKILVSPTHYTLRTWKAWDGHHLRSWRLEGSLEGRQWVPLREHDQDYSLIGVNTSHTWSVDKPRGGFRHFRVIQTCKNASEHHSLALAGFELYGFAFVK